MKLPRVSVAGLMGFVLATGVALAALRNASELWAGFLLLVDLVLIGTALLGVIYLQGKKRAWWLGFGLFGGSYLMLSLSPWLADQVQPKLGTTQLLNYIHFQVVQTIVPGPLALQELESQRTRLSLLLNHYYATLRNRNDPTILYYNQQLNDVHGKINSIVGGGAIGSPADLSLLPTSGNVPPTLVNRWRLILPGAANYEPFQRVGHSLFTLLAGLVGGTIAYRFHAIRLTRPVEEARDSVDLS